LKAIAEDLDQIPSRGLKRFKLSSSP